MIVRLFARLFYRVMGLSGAEALAASANIFVGIESSLTIQPYLLNMTRSELLTVLTCMMATVASTVMTIYVIALHEVFPQIAGHLLSASVISIPCRSQVASPYRFRSVWRLKASRRFRPMVSGLPI